MQLFQLKLDSIVFLFFIQFYLVQNDMPFHKKNFVLLLTVIMSIKQDANLASLNIHEKWYSVF